MLLLLLGCGGSGPGDGLRPADFLGTWSVAAPALARCWDGFEFRFTVEPNDTLTPVIHELTNVVSEWWDNDEPEVRELFSGNFNWGADDFAFVFHESGSIRWRMEGRGVTAEQVTGTIQLVRFAGLCTGPATATHLGR